MSSIEQEEQLTLEGFAPVIKDISQRTPRHPFITQVAKNVDVGPRLLKVEGSEFHDDGEDRFLVAISVEPKYERMLIVKTQLIDGRYQFVEGRGVWVDARYTQFTDRFLEHHFFHVDITRLDNEDEDRDWISLFWSGELDMNRLQPILIQELVEQGARERLKEWFALSPAD